MSKGPPPESRQDEYCESVEIGLNMRTSAQNGEIIATLNFRSSEFFLLTTTLCQPDYIATLTLWVWKIPPRQAKPHEFLVRVDSF